MRHRSGLRVVVAHNTDFSHDSSLSLDDPGAAARADVENAARSIAGALSSRGHRAELLAVADPAAAVAALATDPPSLIFNLCESLRGDARHEIVLPALLDLAAIPYTGSGPLTLGLALRKDRAKEILRARGVPTPEAAVLRSPDDACPLPFPLIVKPTREDASVGISSSSVVRDRPSLRAAVSAIVEGLAQPALVERYVEGRELYVSLLGHPAEPLPLHEIDFTDLPAHLPRIVTYAGKWETDSVECKGTRPVRCSLDGAPLDRAVAVARAAFEALELRDYGRVDVRLAADGTPYVIDVNPNCDLSDGAGFSRAAGFAGLDYPALVERVCLAALARQERERDHVHRRNAPPAIAAAGGDAVAPPVRASAPGG